jgi:hypothetical protein
MPQGAAGAGDAEASRISVNGARGAVPLEGARDELPIASNH